MEIKVNFLDNLRLEAKFDDFTVVADQPIRYKGDGSAPGPFDYFLASSALCAAYFVKLYCSTRNIPTENIRLSQNNIVDPENRYNQIFKIQVELPADISEKDRQGILRSIDRCTVKKVVQAGPEFVIEEVENLDADAQALLMPASGSEGGTFIAGKDLPLEQTIANMSAILAGLGMKIEIASWRNIVPNVWSLHIRDAHSPMCFTNGKGATKEGALASARVRSGGIAYQSASKGTPILMKDINEHGIEQGLAEAAKLLVGRVDKGRMTPAKMAEVLNGIRPTLSYGDFGNVDLVVEAVVENPKVKQAVLAEVENHVREDAILASNTSTISISLLAKALKRPENFVGMHFFNPVHMMPLVEVIRGEKSSDLAVATTVAYAKKMGKNPIVVNDCPGFLVNRVLFPYFGGFARLVSAGVDFVRIDKVMEKFGWPMGPAYLMDVVGIDTGHHGRDVMAEGFPDRMKDDRRSAIDALYEAKRLGQKNGKGFYAYEADKKGKQKKVVDSSVLEVLKPIVYEQRDVTDEDIINWMMIPLCLETVRCLEDGIVETAAEADMGLVYGIGFPLFRGGALRYIDSIGVAEFVALADQYAELGALYHPTAKLREMAKNGQSFFG